MFAIKQSNLIPFPKKHEERYLSYPADSLRSRLITTLMPAFLLCIDSHFSACRYERSAG